MNKQLERIKLSNENHTRFKLEPFSRSDIEDVWSSVLIESHQIIVLFDLPNSLVEHIPYFSKPPSKIRKLGLWNDTCFEFFARQRDEQYQEVNFSLAGFWENLQFKKYREGQSKSNWMQDYSITQQKMGPDRTIIQFTIETGSKDIYAVHSTLILNLNHQLIYFSRNTGQLKPDFHSSVLFLPTKLT